MKKIFKKAEDKIKSRVIVGMSGGIDSAVAAALLKEQGFDVVGVFMKFWAESIRSGENARRLENKCCSLDTQTRARKIASKLGILFYVLNVEKEFKKNVVDYFIKEYESGRTPNPCAICNKEIKFKFLLQKALELKADFVATGHYVNKVEGKNESSKTKIFEGKDKAKDQSYFLWGIQQEEFRKILFPVGNYTKGEVRKLGEKFGLPVASIPESQEVCFVLTSLKEFLGKYIILRPGKIIDQKGKILGVHSGLAYYTIGQRKGIGLSGGPYFVLSKDYKKNALVVTKNRKDLYKKEAFLDNINWISGNIPNLPLKIETKLRYRQKAVRAVIKKDKNRYKLILSTPQKSVTPGQSAVFYKGEELLGGGTIS